VWYNIDNKGYNMENKERIKNLKELIVRVKSAIAQLEYIKINNFSGIIVDDYDFMDMARRNDIALENLQILKYKLLTELKSLQESNQNTVNN